MDNYTLLASCLQKANLLNQKITTLEKENIFLRDCLKNQLEKVAVLTSLLEQRNKYSKRVNNLLNANQEHQRYIIEYLEKSGMMQ